MNLLYSKILDISKEYLGPSAERFLNRQVTYHLNKKTESLTQADIPELAKWIKLSASLVTEDKEIVEQFYNRISALAD